MADRLRLSGALLIRRRVIPCGPELGLLNGPEVGLIATVLIGPEGLIGQAGLGLTGPAGPAAILRITIPFTGGIGALGLGADCDDLLIMIALGLAPND